METLKTGTAEKGTAESEIKTNNCQNNNKGCSAESFGTVLSLPASHEMIQFVLLISLCLLVLSVDRADASGMDFADTVALILGLVIGTVGILACLGRYARRLRAEQY